MQEKLMIYLHANDSTCVGWAVVNALGLVEQSADRDNAQGLAAIAEGKEVIVWVPTQDVLLTTVTLPKMNRSRLAQALPYALEEQLIADVDTLHFAMGEYSPEGELPVMVVAKSKMQEWLAILQAWQIQPDKMLPTVYALPHVNNAWQITINDMAIVRSGLYQGFACDKNNLATCLDFNLTASTLLPEQIHVRNYTAQPIEQSLDIPVMIREESVNAEHWVADLASQSQHLPLFQLLQGHYAIKKSTLPQMKKLVNILIYLSIAWVALIFLYPLISTLILKQRVNAIDSQITQIYKRHFPQASSVVAPKLRMEEKLRKLSAQTGQSQLLSLLGWVGKGMLETPSVKLKRVDFQAGLLTLELTAASSDDFAAFTDFLSQQGLQIKQKNANLTGERVNATLEIES